APRRPDAVRGPVVPRPVAVGPAVPRDAAGGRPGRPPPPAPQPLPGPAAALRSGDDVPVPLHHVAPATGHRRMVGPPAGRRLRPAPDPSRGIDTQRGVISSSDRRQRPFGAPFLSRSRRTCRVS